MNIPIEYLIAGVGALGATIAFLFRLIVSNYVEQIKDKDLRIASLTALLVQNIYANELHINQQLAAKGLPPVETVAPVVAVHNSEPTLDALRDADYETLKARSVAIYKNMGLPPITSDVIAPPKPESWLTRLLPPYKK